VITEGIITVLAGLASFIGNAFGTMSIPGWWTSIRDTIDQLSTAAAGFGQWLPMTALGQALTFIVGAIGVALGIKVVRMLASIFTGGGGSAA
jgi:hypothetical protein